MRKLLLAAALALFIAGPAAATDLLNDTGQDITSIDVTMDNGLSWTYADTIEQHHTYTFDMYWLMLYDILPDDLPASNACAGAVTFHLANGTDMQGHVEFCYMRDITLTQSGMKVVHAVW